MIYMQQTATRRYLAKKEILFSYLCKMHHQLDPLPFALLFPSDTSCYSSCCPWHILQMIKRWISAYRFVCYVISTFLALMYLINKLQYEPGKRITMFELTLWATSRVPFFNFWEIINQEAWCIYRAKMVTFYIMRFSSNFFYNHKT